MYKPIPEGATSVHLYRHWCGDEQCNCHRFGVYANLPARVPGAHGWDGRERYEYLWESSWGSPDSDGLDGFTARMAVDVGAACAHYDIPVDFSESVFDWEGERKL